MYSSDLTQLQNCAQRIHWGKKHLLINCLVVWIVPNQVCLLLPNNQSTSLVLFTRRWTGSFRCQITKGNCVPTRLICLLGVHLKPVSAHWIGTYTLETMMTKLPLRKKTLNDMIKKGDRLRNKMPIPNDSSFLPLLCSCCCIFLISDICFRLSPFTLFFSLSNLFEQFLQWALWLTFSCLCCPHVRLNLGAFFL